MRRYAVLRSKASPLINHELQLRLDSKCLRYRAPRNTATMYSGLGKTAVVGNLQGRNFERSSSLQNNLYTPVLSNPCVSSWPRIEPIAPKLNDLKPKWWLSESKRAQKFNLITISIIVNYIVSSSLESPVHLVAFITITQSQVSAGKHWTRFFLQELLFLPTLQCLVAPSYASYITILRDNLEAFFIFGFFMLILPGTSFGIEKWWLKNSSGNNYKAKKRNQGSLNYTIIYYYRFKSIFDSMYTLLWWDSLISFSLKLYIALIVCGSMGHLMVTEWNKTNNKLHFLEQ